MRVLREGPVKITRTTIDNAWRRREQKTRLLIGDFDCRGLALVVNPTGMSWRFDFKPRGIDATTGRRFAPRRHPMEVAEVNIFNLAKNAGTSVEQIERFYARNLPLSAEMARNLQSFGGGN